MGSVSHAAVLQTRSSWRHRLVWLYRYSGYMPWFTFGTIEVTWCSDTSRPGLYLSFYLTAYYLCYGVWSTYLIYAYQSRRALRAHAAAVTPGSTESHWPLHLRRRSILTGAPGLRGWAGMQ